MRLLGVANSVWNRMTSRTFKYAPLPTPANSRSAARGAKHPHPSDSVWSGQNRRLLKISMMGLVLILVLYVVVSFSRVTSATSGGGFTAITPHLWGQYSPVFKVPSDISPAIPSGCTVTFVQLLSRHGARDPTQSRTEKYAATIAAMQRSVTEYGEGYEFLQDYIYRLGADELTAFGEKQMIDAGASFYRRYRPISNHTAPFVRASGQNRVIQSAVKWAEGYDGSKRMDLHLAASSTGGVTIIPEGEGFNNTLDHGLCLAFEETDLGGEAQMDWAQIFVPQIRDRLNANLKGANLDIDQTIQLMDICPMDTISYLDAHLSQFCHLFTVDEWKSYDYYQSLGKYYGHGDGNPLGPTQGVGWVNELIARLTKAPVVDHTTTNATLDQSDKTFPLDRAIYADFSHDNTMASVYAAMGLYANTKKLSKKARQSPVETGGFSASWTVPFGGRMFVEKMVCSGDDAELVRVLVNDRVIPLSTCKADDLGRCNLDAFVESLAFARKGGEWDKCFT